MAAPPPPPWWLDFAGGVVGGCAGVVIGHPLDTIKLRLQAGQFGSSTQAFKQTVRAEGAAGLFKGMVRASAPCCAAPLPGSP